MRVVTGRLGLKAEDGAQARWRRQEAQLGGPDREGVRAGGLEEAGRSTWEQVSWGPCGSQPRREGKKKALLHGESCLTWHLCVGEYFRFLNAVIKETRSKVTSPGCGEEGFPNQEVGRE